MKISKTSGPTDQKFFLILDHGKESRYIGYRSSP